MYSFPNMEPVCCSISSSNCCFLICIQISQGAGQVIWCKTQNSGLRSKEEKPSDPINQSSRCKRKRVYWRLQTGWLWSPGRQSTQNSKLGRLFIDKKKTYYQHITCGLQSDWLHVCKAILLVQTSRATCLQSNSIGTNGAGFCSNLGARGLFSSPTGFYWVHIDWLAPGHPMGAGNPTISQETETQVLAACQPQPRQPHIKLISQLQKSTRKISDTWIIDTGKRETRYRLVKIHQTIRQPHTGIPISFRIFHSLWWSTQSKALA